MKAIYILVLLLVSHASSYYIFTLLNYRLEYLKTIFLLSAIFIAVPLLSGSILLGFLVAAIALISRVGVLSSDHRIAAFFGLFLLVPNDAAYYLNVGFDFGGVDYVKLLSLLLFVPLGMNQNLRIAEISRSNVIDKFVYMFFAWQIISRFISDDMAFTPALRFSFWYVITVVFPYLAIRFCLKDFKLIVPLLGYALVAQMILAVGEGILSWKVYETYTHLAGYFEKSHSMYKFRNGFLRVESSFGNPLILALFTNISFVLGVILYRANKQGDQKARIGALLVILVSVLAAFFTGSRAAMAGLVVIYAIYRFLMWAVSKPSDPVTKFFAVFLVFGVVFSPQMKDFAQDNFDYRYRLIEASIPVIQSNLLMGRIGAIEDPRMEVMRQGEGIIDIVNTYLYMALFHGLIGLFLYCGALFFAVKKSYKVLRHDCQDSMMGTFLLVSTILVALNLATTSPIGWSYNIVWLLLPMLSNFVERNRDLLR